MAKPTTFRGSVVALYLEGTTPGQFIKPCGLTNHSFNFTKQTNDIDVPDCDDPDLATWMERDAVSFDFSVTGSGMLAAEALPVWWGAFASTASINARTYIGRLDDTQHGRYWGGKLHITNFEVTGERRDRAMVSVTAVSDGEMTLHTITT